MRNRLPTRTLMFLGAMYAALTLGAAAAQAAPQRHVNWSETASPGIIEGAPRADQVLLTGSKRHTCQALHVTFDAGGQAQSASLLLRRAGRPDVRVDTETDTRGTLDAALRPGQGLAAGRLDPVGLDRRGGEGLGVVPEHEGPRVTFGRSGR